MKIQSDAQLCTKLELHGAAFVSKRFSARRVPWWMWFSENSSEAWKTLIEYEFDKLSLTQKIDFDSVLWINLIWLSWQEGCRRAYEFLVPSFCATSLAAEPGALSAPHPLLPCQVAPTRSMTRTWLAKRRRQKIMGRCFEELRITTIYPKMAIRGLVDSLGRNFAFFQVKQLVENACKAGCGTNRLFYGGHWSQGFVISIIIQHPLQNHSGHSCCFCLGRCFATVCQDLKVMEEELRLREVLEASLYERFLSRWEVVKNPCHV